MSSNLLQSLRRLTDDELVGRVRALTDREREDVVQVIAHLAELDTRDVHFRAGYASLFAYCRDALGLSEADAYNRIEVARAARRFPVVLDRLAEGAVNATAVRLLAPHMTVDNHEAVLESARGKSRSEVEELVARLAPRPDATTSLRRLPLGAASPPLALVSPTALSSSTDHASPPVPSPPWRAGGPVTSPLAPDRYRLVVTIGYATLQKLRLAKDMLRHAIPSGDEAAILDRALTALLEDLAKKKFAATENPRPGRPTAEGSRHVPAEVKRTVWLRDAGRCAFVGEGGRRCTELGFLEFHHLKPYVVGGPATVQNIQLRCRRHNDYEARVFFGRPATG
jgi:hypothetical protein